jgi:hypothetical protein
MIPADFTPSRRQRLDALVSALVAVLFLLSFLETLAAWRLGAVHGNDFKHLWAGARMLSLGGNPYDARELMRFAVLQGWVDAAGNPVINPFVYLPTTGLLLNPLAALPYPRALLMWYWLNWAAAWALVLAGPGLMRVARPSPARLAGAVFLAAAFPFYRQMTAGQMNVVAAWLTLLALAALRRRRELTAGALLAIGFAWKLAPVLLIAALAPLGRRRGCLVGVALGLALWAASLTSAGPAVQLDALRVIGQMGYGRSTWSEFGRDYYRDPFNQSPNALLHHLLTANPHTTPWLALPPVVANALTVAVSLALIGVWLARRRPLLAAAGPENENGGEPALFLAASLAMLLLPSLMWDHYLVQTLPALLWLAGDARTARRWPRALGLLAVMVLLAWPWRHDAPVNRAGLGILLMSLRLWPTSALYLWLLLDRPAPDAPAPRPIDRA